MTLESGERQVAPTIDGIRRDHVARYEFVAGNIPINSRVIDFACGIGYGTNLLAKETSPVHGFDIDAEAVDYARKHYGTYGAAFNVADGANPGDLAECDIAVCFETIEHIKDPRPLMKALRKSAYVLYASVPNESEMPYEPIPGQTYAFHHRHYTKGQFASLLAECGWDVRAWYGQAGPESEVERGAKGRTLIAVCDPCEPFELPIDDDEPEKGKHVAILGLGPSLDQYLEITKRVGGKSKFCDETWAINALGDVFACDLVFHMDDVRIQEIRAKARPDSNIAAMLKWLKTSAVPVVTSRAHPDFPALVPFPLEDVLNNLGHDYFNNTAAYAIAFAIHTGATKISCFGMDFTYPNVHDAEKGRACVEFWLGMAKAFGIELWFPQTTTLLDACHTRASRLYGYDTVDVEFDHQADGYLKLNFTERETLPTADEIEANYDHSAPIADQHKEIKA